MRGLTPVSSIVLGLAVVVAAAVGLAWFRAAADEAVTGSVTLLGDSLNVGVAPYLEAELDGWKIDGESRVGRVTEQGIEVARSLGPRLAPVVVVSLGTNDPQADAVGFRRRVDELLRVAGARRCVIWSTIWLGGPNAGFNDVLRAEARRRPNLEVSDWASAVGADRTLVGTDGVHGSPAGYAERAARIAELARRCLPPP
jgi:lysophospholipase L1-like esterase